MFRIDGADAVGSLPAFGTAGTPGYFADGTHVSRDWFNQIQEELIAVLAAGSVTPAKGTNTQIRDAIAAMIKGTVQAASDGYWRPYGTPLIIQWCRSASQAAGGGEGSLAVNFPLVFPTACLFCMVGTQWEGVASVGGDAHYVAVSWNASACTVQKNLPASANDLNITRALILAIGH